MIRAPDEPSDVVLLEGVEKVIFVVFIFSGGITRIEACIVINIGNTEAKCVLDAGITVQKWMIRIFERW